MAKIIQQLLEHTFLLLLLFSGGETKDYIHCTACMHDEGWGHKEI